MLSPHFPADNRRRCLRSPNPNCNPFCIKCKIDLWDTHLKLAGHPRRPFVRIHRKSLISICFLSCKFRILRLRATARRKALTNLEYRLMKASQQSRSLTIGLSIWDGTRTWCLFQWWRPSSRTFGCWGSKVCLMSKRRYFLITMANARVVRTKHRSQAGRVPIGKESCRVSLLSEL